MRLLIIIRYIKYDITEGPAMKSPKVLVKLKSFSLRKIDNPGQIQVSDLI